MAPRQELHTRLANVGVGKVALVVGASRGMGRQIALDLATVGGYTGVDTCIRARAALNVCVTVVVAAKTRSKYLNELKYDTDANSPEVRCVSFR